MKNKKFLHSGCITKLSAIAAAILIGLMTVLSQGALTYAAPAATAQDSTETVENTQDTDAQNADADGENADGENADGEDADDSTVTVENETSQTFEPGDSAKTVEWTQRQIDDFYTYEKYYAITSLDEFLAFREECRSGLNTSKIYVVLFCDIDMTGQDFNGIESFSGRFDGNGYTISGLKISGESGAIGLFDYVEESGIVENLNVKIEIASDNSNNYVGGIAGVNAGLIYGCNVCGVIAGTGATGGVVGVNGEKGVVGECTNYAVVNSMKSVGGIAGENRGWVYSCNNEGHINADSEWLDYEDSSDISLNLEGIIDYVSSASDDGSDIGGIAGLSLGDIEMCSNNGTVGYKHSGENVGGIAGRFDGNIIYCTNTGHVYGKKDVGGIAGQFEPEIIGDGEAVLKSSVSNMKTSADSAYNNALDSVLDEAVRYESGEYDDEEKEIKKSKDDVDEMQEAIEKDKKEHDENKTDSEVALESDLQSMRDSLNDMSNFLADKEQSLKDIANGKSAIEDYSALDPDNNDSSRVSVCVNQGQVNADRNVGGIAGNMGIEGQDSDNSTLDQTNDSYKTLAVLEYCQNEGILVVKKENGGGITGYGDLGLIRGCESTGAIYGEDANYLGNVAGQFAGTIDSCNAAGVIYGDDYLGGIAGSARRVRHCNSMSAIPESEGWVGSILGDVYAESEDDDVSILHSSMKTTIYDNYFVGDDIYGVAGSNYQGIAEAITYEQMLVRAGDTTESGEVTNTSDKLSIFSNLKVVFLDPNYDEISHDNIKYGSRVSSIEYPHYSTDDDDDEYAQWTGFYSDSVTGNIYLVYDAEALITALSSQLLDEESGKPIAYIGGRFTAVSKFTFEDVTEGAELPSGADKSADGHVYNMSVTHTYESDGSDIRVRVLNQDPEATINVYVTKNGKWKKVSTELKGSYYEFAPGSTECQIYVEFIKENKTLRYIILAGAAVVLILVLLKLGMAMKNNFQEYQKENKKK